MASNVSVVQYLSSQKETTDNILAERWTYIEYLYNEKSWNNLTYCLTRYMQCVGAFQNEEKQMEIYKNFISTFEMEISPFQLIELLEGVVEHISDKSEAVMFLEKLKEKVKICDEAVWYIKVLQGNLYLNYLNDLENTKQIIEELREAVDEAGTVSPVHGIYYVLTANYYQRVGQRSDYYRCGLQLLGCSLEGVYNKEELLDVLMSWHNNKNADHGIRPLRNRRL